MLWDMSTSRIDHDQLFKRLIETFFAEFMHFFFPDVHNQLDFTHLRFLPKEMYADLTAGEKREVDLLVETKLRKSRCLLIIHTEHQESHQKQFAERMYLYFSRLYDKYRCKILPIAIFGHGRKNPEPEQFVVRLPFKKVLTFSYLVVQLRKKGWREFLKQDNPVAAALMSRAGYQKGERVQVKLEFLRMITRLGLDPARMQLIIGFFETYVRLNKAEETDLELQIRELHPKEEEQIMELYTSWELKGMKQGVKQGIQQGMQQGMQTGERLAKLEMARKLLSEGLLSIDKIVEITGLSKAEIEQH